VHYEQTCRHRVMRMPTVNLYRCTVSKQSDTGLCLSLVDPAHGPPGRGTSKAPYHPHRHGNLQARWGWMDVSEGR